MYAVQVSASFDPYSITLNDETYKKMKIGLKFCCQQVKKHVPNYETNSFYQVHEELFKDLEKLNKGELFQPNVQEAQRRLKDLYDKKAEILYEQARSTVLSNEAWKLFTDYMITKYKESLMQDGIRFESLHKEYTDLSEKTRDYFIENKDIGKEYKMLVGSYTCMHYLLNQHKQELMDKADGIES